MTHLTLHLHKKRQDGFIFMEQIGSVNEKCLFNKRQNTVEKLLHIKQGMSSGLDHEKWHLYQQS